MVERFSILKLCYNTIMDICGLVTGAFALWSGIFLLDHAHLLDRLIYMKFSINLRI